MMSAAAPGECWGTLCSTEPTKSCYCSLIFGIYKVGAIYWMFWFLPFSGDFTWEVMVLYVRVMLSLRTPPLGRILSICLLYFPASSFSSLPKGVMFLIYLTNLKMVLIYIYFLRSSYSSIWFLCISSTVIPLLLLLLMALFTVNFIHLFKYHNF